MTGFWRFNRRTLLHPKAVHDLKQLMSKVVDWEDKMGQDGGRTQGNTSCDLEDGGVDGASPPDVQDVVYQNVDGVSEDCDKLKQRILVWAANKVANSVGPVPMDVAWVHNEEHCERVEQEDVGAVTVNTEGQGQGQRSRVRGRGRVSNAACWRSVDNWSN